MLLRHFFSEKTDARWVFTEISEKNVRDLFFLVVHLSDSQDHQCFVCKVFGADLCRGTTWIWGQYIFKFDWALLPHKIMSNSRLPFLFGSSQDEGPPNLQIRELVVFEHVPTNDSSWVVFHRELFDIVRCQKFGFEGVVHAAR